LIKGSDVLSDVFDRIAQQLLYLPSRPRLRALFVFFQRFFGKGNTFAFLSDRAHAPTESILQRLTSVREARSMRRKQVIGAPLLQHRISRVVGCLLQRVIAQPGATRRVSQGVLLTI
jgi:hypothetical protein